MGVAPNVSRRRVSSQRSVPENAETAIAAYHKRVQHLDVEGTEYLSESLSFLAVPNGGNRGAVRMVVREDQGRRIVLEHGLHDLAGIGHGFPDGSRSDEFFAEDQSLLVEEDQEEFLFLHAGESGNEEPLDLSRIDQHIRRGGSGT